MIDLTLPAPDLAPRLLGCRLVVAGHEAIICETEAYQGREDLACHAAKGRTRRTEVLFWEPGYWYCYLCYGMHVLVNIVCHQADVPAAVLLRGVTLAGEALNGPGKLSRRLGIGLADNATRLGERLELLPGRADGPVHCGPRVGVAYAGPVWSNRPWRFWLQGFPARKQLPYGI